MPALPPAIGRLLRLEALPAAWRVPCFAALGVAAGLGGVVAHAGRATSYLSDSPETCANCHVMYPQYLTWQHSSHREVATCNDCHVPHDGLISQYAFKAQDGNRHAFMFTFRLEPQVIRISRGAVPVVQANCVRCHGDVVQDVTMRDAVAAGRQCWDCHREVPHGRERSLSATPRSMTPQLPLPDSFAAPAIGGRSVRPDPEKKP